MVVNIIFIGIGCSIGGYVGDVMLIVNLLVFIVDYLIINFNIVNVFNFINLKNNVVYVEGYFIDLFCGGYINFYFLYVNIVGLIIEKLEDWKIDILFNLINVVRVIYGVNIIDFVIIDELIYSWCI